MGFPDRGGGGGLLRRVRPAFRQRGEIPMAMTMTGEVQLPASQEIVWAKLNDPEVLKVCIPGCESLEKLSDTEFQAVATNKIGPVKARFKGKVRLTDLNPPNGYRISGEGDGGVAGFAKGGATVALQPKDGGTLLSYNVEAQIGGKLAQIGQRLVNGAAKKLADEFFTKFAGAVGAKQESEGGAPKESGAEASKD
jgi:carbon monoxide dehydrogenase subunit G